MAIAHLVSKFVSFYFVVVKSVESLRLSESESTQRPCRCAEAGVMMRARVSTRDSDLRAINCITDESYQGFIHVVILCHLFVLSFHF